VEGKRTEEEEGHARACCYNKLGFFGALTVGWCARLSS